MDPKLRGRKTPYSEARVYPPLKPLPFPARFRGSAPKNPIFFYICVKKQERLFFLAKQYRAREGDLVTCRIA